MSFVARNHPQQTAKHGARETVDDRRTPDDLFAECCALAGIYHFDLDPCARDESTRGRGWYTLDEDGLSKPWSGNVWLNPPYSALPAWMEKVDEERARCRNIVCLLPANRTEQGWWHDFIEEHARAGTYRVFNLKGRRRFDRPGWTKTKKGDRPPFGMVLVVIPGCASSPSTLNTPPQRRRAGPA